MHDPLMRTALIILTACLTASLASADDVTWKEILLEEVDTSLLSPLGHRLLRDDAYDWKHASTEHFVIHFERKQFAQKVASMAEFFYSFISEDIRSPGDPTEGPSHIFIFRREKSWEHFIEEYNIATEWAFSMVSGYTMFLQQAEERKASGSILGHEMTHLVFNRLLRGRLPLWLSEGTAEWYGTFGYEAYRSIRRSKRSAFRRLKDIYPLHAVLNAYAYPEDPDAVESFYQTSKYLVGFLQVNYPEEAFGPFLMDVLKGTPSLTALGRHYEIASVEELEKEFRRFSR